MTPPSMESIFLILSGAILAAGVLYWFWSHIQLTQKKVQLLENAVFELRGMLTSGSGSSVSASPSASPSASDQEQENAPVAESQYNDLPDDDWDTPVQKSTSLEELQGQDDDLQPGGRAIGSGSPSLDVKEVQSETEFRELFVQPPSPSPAKADVKEVSSDSLEGMPVKELRRLAEQRGLTGVSDLKKKELISALRQQIAPTEMQATLDLTEPVVEAVELQDATVLE